jgi:two-component sensor histidine kinase
VDFPLKQSGSRPGGIRATIALLVLIPVLVPLFAAVLLWMGERDANVLANDRVMSAARVAGANVRLLVESTQERLSRIDEALARDPARFRAPSSTVAQGFTALYDANGFVVDREGQRENPIGDNAEFKLLAGGKDWVITPLLGTETSLRFFGIAKRLERNGAFAGVIAAYLPGDALAKTWNEASLGVQSTIGVIRNDGWLVTRYPMPAETLDLKGTRLFEALAEAPEGTYVSPTSPVDQVSRRVGYVSFPDLELIVTASMSRTSTTEAFIARVSQTAMVTAPIFIAMVFLCGWAIILLMRHERNSIELENALARNQMLFKEIHHRVKNNLQQVNSLIRLQQAPAAMKEDLTRRITAMSAVHQHIYESDQFGVLDAEAYLARVLKGLRESAPPGVSLDWSLAPLQLSPDQAMPLGMIVNEIVLNAFKHGFPDGRAGLVVIKLERPLEGNEAILSVSDNGVGMSDTPAGGLGLGTRLITGLAQQLGGRTVVTRDNGVRVELRFPADVISKRVE